MEKQLVSFYLSFLPRTCETPLFLSLSWGIFVEESGNPVSALPLVTVSTLPVGEGQASDGGEIYQVILSLDLLFCCVLIRPRFTQVLVLFVAGFCAHFGPVCYASVN